MLPFKSDIDMLLFATLLINTGLMVFGPVVVVSTTKSLFEIHYDEMLSESVCPGVTNIVTTTVNPSTTGLLLQLAGDVEVNPGPQNEPEETPFARSMRLGLANLLIGAPEKVHEVLSVEQYQAWK